jgi:TPR repeat protein
MDYCITSDKQYVCTKCVDRMNMRYSSVNNLTLSDVISYCKEPMGMSDPTFRYNESTRVLHKLSEKGDEHAQYRLGCKYEIGQDVPLDLKTASKLYARSAEQGNVQALGRLLSLATKDENPDAQCYLGEMYFSGQGVPEDRKEAQRLLETSKRNGNVRAHQFLDSLNETPRKKVEPAYFNMDKPWGDVAW